MQVKISFYPLIFGDWQWGGFEKNIFWICQNSGFVGKFVFTVLGIELSGAVCKIESD